MARFLSYDEIERGLVPTRETLSEIASDFMQLEAFQSGGAVVFGSVAWGEHTWRSDIDVADYSNREYRSRVQPAISEYFRKRYGSDMSFWVGKFMVEIIGSQRLRFKEWTASHYRLPEMSPSTRDHFRLLAQAKGGQWQVFLEKITTIRFQSRKTDILDYLDIMESNLTASEVFRKEIYGRERGGYRCFWNEFHGLQSLENFPRQLMRKILGQLKRLPSPDTFSRIKFAFALLEEPWAVELQTHFQPFYEIDRRYNELMGSMVGNGERRLSDAEYAEEICHLFEHLPVMPIIEAVRRLYPKT